MCSQVLMSLASVLLTFLGCRGSSPSGRANEGKLSRALVHISLPAQIDTAIIWAPLIADGQISGTSGRCSSCICRLTQIVKAPALFNNSWLPDHNMKLFTALDFCLLVLIGWNQSHVCSRACQQGERGGGEVTYSWYISLPIFNILSRVSG